jgi:putative transposase
MVQGLLDDIRAHAAARPQFGYRRIHVLLRRGGWRVNHKRVYRIYRAEGFAVRRRKREADSYAVADQRDFEVTF